MCLAILYNYNIIIKVIIMKARFADKLQKFNHKHQSCYK